MMPGVIAVPRADYGRCIECGEPVKHLESIHSGRVAARVTSHLEHDRNPETRCRYDSDGGLGHPPLEPYPGDF